MTLHRTETFETASARAARNYQRLKDQHRCVSCAELLPQGHTPVRCPTCLTKTGSSRERVAIRLLSGKCTRCGDANTSKRWRTCDGCREAMRIQRQSWSLPPGKPGIPERDRAPIEAPRDRTPGCPICGLRGEHVCLRGSALDRRNGVLYPEGG